jgi:hypothetical protein
MMPGPDLGQVEIRPSTLGVNTRVRRAVEAAGASCTRVTRSTAALSAMSPHRAPRAREVGADANEEEHAGEEHGGSDVAVGGLAGGHACGERLVGLLVPAPSPAAYCHGSVGVESELKLAT